MSKQRSLLSEFPSFLDTCTCTVSVKPGSDNKMPIILVSNDPSTVEAPTQNGPDGPLASAHLQATILHVEPTLWTERLDGRP